MEGTLCKHLRQLEGCPFPCRPNPGGLNATDIPKRPRSGLSAAFGSVENFAPGPAPQAVEFQAASFSWQIDSAAGAETSASSGLIGKGTVLRDVSLTIPQGKLVVIHGPVGSGECSCIHAQAYDDV